METKLKRLAGATIAGLAVMAAGAAFAETVVVEPAYRETTVTNTYMRTAPVVVVKGNRSSLQTIPQYVDGTPEIIRGLPFDLATLEGTVTVASHPARLGNPEPPPVPLNLDTGYLGAPLIQSRGN